MGNSNPGDSRTDQQVAQQFVEKDANGIDNNTKGELP